MTKRVAIIGAGTAGAVSAAHFAYQENFKEKVEVEWYADSAIPAQAVGEGSNLVVPRHLLQIMNFTYNDLREVDGTFKSGIAKYNWGKKNSYYFHDFAPPTIGYHFNATKLQQYIVKRLEEQGRVSLVNKNVTSNSVDADYIVDCSGRPKVLDDNFHEFKNIPVNSVYVTQCFWEFPRFQYTLTIARPYGWVFGIPLQGRCSIGYLYNNNINTLEEVKEDVKNVFEQFNLTPSDTTNSFSFYSYCRKQNFTERVAFNGNASFFSEPLEATTIGNMMQINKLVTKILNGEIPAARANKTYLFSNQGVLDMISLHYLAGSCFETKFWEHAETLAKRQICLAKENTLFRQLCEAAIAAIKNNSPYSKTLREAKKLGEYGTWASIGYTTNIRGLGIEDKLEHIFNVDSHTKTL